MKNEMMKDSNGVPMFDAFSTDPFFDSIGRDFFRSVMANNPTLQHFSHFMSTDIQEKDNGYVMYIDMPGFKKEDISLTYVSGILTVSGTRHTHQSKETSEHRFVRNERSTGHASRSYHIGQIDPSQIDATYEAGILTIQLPYMKEAIKGNIPIH
ncbi:Hsp20/alpha crystallin family protein [Vagococcus humatus]|uniref:SHSP domain-containing protein n=1 Tax=Vagococcus humatus TaxID=1889241 RepID=A0A3S0AY62_9ENTE|nr:Hsp20/alpha crystallin family protein [Vagococcus humatus]RST89852.1 hypothetical protein C7P63_01875 [Vagococcus humatus]